jgi:hypothetical protein
LDEAPHLVHIPRIFSKQAALLHTYRAADNIAESLRQFPIPGGIVYSGAIDTYVGLSFILFFGFSLVSLRLFYALIELMTDAGLRSVLINREWRQRPRSMSALLHLPDEFLTPLSFSSQSRRSHNLGQEPSGKFGVSFRRKVYAVRLPHLDVKSGGKYHENLYPPRL